MPTAFYFSDDAKTTHNRTNLLFYAGTPNSCTRKIVDRNAKTYWKNGDSQGEDKNLAATGMYDSILEREEEFDFSDVIVKEVVPREEWADHMYKAKYCLVPDGFSSISARFYEVILHGCVPVLITEAFHGAFEHTILWGEFVVLIKRSEVKRIPEILRAIPEEQYKHMHNYITIMHPTLHIEAPSFWYAIFKELWVKKLEANRVNVRPGNHGRIMQRPSELGPVDNSVIDM